MSFQTNHIVRPAASRVMRTEAPQLASKFARSLHSSENRVPECVELRYFRQSIDPSGFMHQLVATEVFCPEGSRPSENLPAYTVLAKNDFAKQVEKAAHQRIQNANACVPEAWVFLVRSHLPSEPYIS